MRNYNARPHPISGGAGAVDAFVLSVICYWLAASLSLVVIVALVRMVAGTLFGAGRAFYGVLAGMFILALVLVTAGYAVSTESSAIEGPPTALF